MLVSKKKPTMMADNFQEFMLLGANLLNGMASSNENEVRTLVGTLLKKIDALRIFGCD